MVLAILIWHVDVLSYRVGVPAWWQRPFSTSYTLLACIYVYIHHHFLWPSLLLSPYLHIHTHTLHGFSNVSVKPWWKVFAVNKGDKGWWETRNVCVNAGSLWACRIVWQELQQPLFFTCSTSPSTTALLYMSLLYRKMKYWTCQFIYIKSNK